MRRRKKKAETLALYITLKEKEKDAGDLPRVLDDVERLSHLAPLYLRWKAFDRPMSLTDLLNSPTWLVDGLLTLEWVSQKVNEKKD